MFTHSLNTNIRRTAAVILSSASMLAAGAALPTASHATDATTSSGWFCPSYSTPWLLYNRMAGYKCFQYSNGSGLSSAAVHY